MNMADNKGEGKLVLKPIPPRVETGIKKLLNTAETPFYVYDESGIRESARSLKRAFAWASGFKNYFAVKACPNPSILQVLREEGFGADCSSLPELEIAKMAGIAGEEIMFTSNDTPANEFARARELGGIINLDDITHIDFLERNAGIPDLISFRYNPGPLREGNPIIGKPQDAKYGLTREQLLEAYSIMKRKGVKRFGLHTMVISNELDPAYFVETARMLFGLVAEISQAVGIRFEFVNMGGGIGIPYKPEQKPVDLGAVGEGVKKAYKEMVEAKGLAPLKIFLECGRLITGPHGYLVSRVRHVARKYKDFVGLDACMANLMRPAMYGAYHHITVLGKEKAPLDRVYDVTGSLCENNDKFAIDRPLPEIAPGDTVVIHDAGAHGHAMGFNYNGKLRSAEFLLEAGGKAEMIRRGETVADYLDTLVWPGPRG